MANKLTGDIQLVQQNVRITPAAGGDFANVPITSPLGETLGRIDSLATRISLGGTLAQSDLQTVVEPGPGRRRSHGTRRSTRGRPTRSQHSWSTPASESTSGSPASNGK